MVSRTWIVVVGILVGSVPLVAANTSCTGAELYSRQTVKYGRWEIRMMAGAKSGTVSSFFTYYDHSHEGGGEPWREIDIEILGKNPRSFQSNLITGTSSARAMSALFHDDSDDLSKRFHTFALEWTPDSIVWEIDGRRVRKTGSDSQVLALREKPHSYRMNLWASAWPEWSGPFDTKTLPACQIVNWIRYQEYTPGKGPGGSNFTTAWVDDFDSFDEVRWGKGTWGFEGNYARFDPENLQIRDGLLVLALTRKGEEGVGCGYSRGMFPEDPLGRSYPRTNARPISNP